MSKRGDEANTHMRRGVEGIRSRRRRGGDVTREEIGEKYRKKEEQSGE